MGSIGMALCILMLGNVGTSSSPESSVGLSAKPESVYLQGLSLASLSGPSMKAPTMKVMPTLASLDRARFFEDNDEEIYHENTKSIVHAFGLALLPNLFYKPLAMGLAWHYCDKDQDHKKKYLAFLTAVPAAGFGSYYGEWHWAGVIATVGDLTGSVLMSWYFYDEHAVRNEPGGSQTKLWAGLGVSMFFWVFDMVMGPIAAMQFNSKLRKRYLRKKSPAPKSRIFVTPPHPDSGLADIGPQPTDRKPVVIGYSGRF